MAIKGGKRSLEPPNRIIPSHSSPLVNSVQQPWVIGVFVLFLFVIIER